MGKKDKPRDPEYCGDTDCPERGVWGMGGLPAGHFVHYTKKGSYLAHGTPSPEDRAQWAQESLDEYNKAHERILKRLRARLDWVS